MQHVPANHNPQAGKQNRNTSITTVFQIWVEERRKREAKLNRDMNSETTDRERGNTARQHWAKRNTILKVKKRSPAGSQSFIRFKKKKKVTVYT